MLRQISAWIACWLALTLVAPVQQRAPAQEPAPNQPASKPTPEHSAKLAERDKLIAQSKSLRGEGRLSEAIEAAKQVLVIDQELFGVARAENVGTYGWIAAMYEATEDFPQAETSRQAALDLLTKLHGVGDWRVTDGRLALEYTRLLARLDRSERKELSRLGTLDQQSSALYAARKGREALSVTHEALEIRKKLLGEQHPDYASSLNNLGELFRLAGDFARAEPLLRQALEISRKVLGEEHPSYASTLNNLALLYSSMGDHARSEPLQRQSLEIRRRLSGEDHASYANGLNNLGLLHITMGDYARAEPLYREALAIRKKVLGDAHPHYADSLNNLAGLYRSMGDYAGAEPLYRRSLEINKNVLGEEHPSYALSLNNLAMLYDVKGEYARAEPLCRQALEIRKKVLGAEHPEYAGSLNNLARLYRSMGDYARAEQLHREALEIRKKVLGPEHPDYAASLRNLAWMYYSLGDHMNSLAQLRDGVTAYEAARLRVNVQSLSRAAFGVDQSPYQLLAAVEAQHGDAIEAWRALEADLARGLLDEASSRAGLQLTAAEEQERVDLNAALEKVQPRILRLVTQSVPDKATAELAELLELRSAAETGLARLAAALSRRQVAELKEVQDSLSANAAFVTWVDLASKEGTVQEHWGCVVRANRQPVWVRLSGTGQDRTWTDEDIVFAKRFREALAQAAALEKVEELSRQLAAQRIEPLLPHLDGVERLFVAAVNAMAGVPIEALTDRFSISYTPSGTQLARLRARQRPSRHATLLALGDPVFNRPGDGGERPASSRLPPGGLLVNQIVPEGNAAQARIEAGDVLLAYAGTELSNVQQLGELVTAHAMDASITVTVWRESQDQPIERKLLPGKLGVVLARDRAPEAIARRRENDLLLANVTRGKIWDELPGTRIEIAGLGKLFADDQVTLLADSDASEQRLVLLRESGELARFRYLHLATHGQVNRASNFESALILAQDHLSTADDVAAGAAFYDGRLTANEILKQWKLNAELVTLSSCESGLGREGGGEGFLGFAQALLLAGSRSVCLSLWEVDDTATALLMDRFYQNLLGKRAGLESPLPKAEALAEAKRWLRSLTVKQAAELAASLSHGVARGAGHKTTVVKLPPPTAPDPAAHPYEHPYYWAAFVLIGDAE